MPFRLRGRTGKRRMGGELRAGEVSVAVSSPAKEKCIWRTPLSRCPVQAEAFGHVSRACPCFALLYTHDAVHKAVAAAAVAAAGRAGGLGGWTDSELPMTCDLLAPLGEVRRDPQPKWVPSHTPWSFHHLIFLCAQVPQPKSHRHRQAATR